MTKFTKNDKMVRNEDRPSLFIDGELVLLDAERGEYQVMKGSARRVWELLEQPRTYEELITILSGEYNISPVQCRDELLSSLNEFDELGLVEVAS